MALSFKDSLKQARIQTPVEEVLVATPMVMSLEPEVEAVPAVMSYDVALTAEEPTWTFSNKYYIYDEYSDDAVSTIDANKNISLNDKQLNITQERNSQFIPFVMPRYYDGYDLMKANLIIHFVNKNGFEANASPVNVHYSDSEIRFGWLVDHRVTALDGKVRFEIQAIGVNSKNEQYIWKTKPNGELNILASLTGNGEGIIEPDETWITGFLGQVMEQVGFANSAATEAINQAQAAAQSAADAQTTVETAQAELEAAVDAKVTTEIGIALEAYYTSEQTEEYTSEQIAIFNGYLHENYYNKNLTDEIIDDKIRTALIPYYVSSHIDEVVVRIDDEIQEVNDKIASMDGLANFNVEYDGSTMTFYNGETIMKEIKINSDPSAEWTAAYTAGVDEKIATASQTAETNLNTYKETVNADLQAIHETIDELPETLANDYYTKSVTDEKFATKESLSAVETKVGAAEANIATNKTDIGTLGNKVGALETIVSSIDTSPRKTYNMTYDAEYKLTLEEIENEGLENEKRDVKSQFVIQGGAGGGTTSILKIEYVTKTPLVVTVNDKAEIVYNFSGEDSSGDVVLEGVATWKVNGVVVATNTAVAGENKFDVTDFITVGTQKVVLSITDEAGSLVTKSWTVQKVDVRLESNFNDKLTYPLGDVSMAYTPYGAIAKDVHFKLDGKEIGTVSTSASGVPMAYNLPAQSHGAHLVEAYITAEINGNTIESNHIFKDIMWWDSASKVPVISCVTTEINTTQHATTNIEFTAIDPTTETPTVVLAENGVAVQTLTLDAPTHVWQYKSTEIGTHTLTITCGETVKTITANITKLDIDIEPVTAGLVFDFNPVGRSNNDANRLWSSGDIAMSVSDNFDWINGGYQIDENGDQYFSIKAGTSATINYQMFADDAKRNGKEFKLVFMSENVRQPDAVFMSCVDGDDDKVGVEMKVHEAYLYASAGELYLPYSEEDIIEFEININNNQNAIPMATGYEDGVSTQPMVYTDSHNFTQTNPQYITLGSPDCDLRIYRFKVYNTELTDKGILNNFIADARNAEEMIARYNRNQIYDENQKLTPEILAERCPQLRIIKIEAPYFTNNKSDKVPNTKIQMIYKDGDPVLDNWTAYDSLHSGQGTSSNNYGAAARNLDLIIKANDDFGNDPYIILGDGKTRVSKVALTRKSVPVNYFNVKVNVASSENANNALLQKHYNDFNPYNRAFVRPEGEDTSFIKDTMEFQNCVVFIRETDENVSTHREFADTEWHFYAIGNVGDSKKTDKTRLTDPSDPYECCVEIMDVELPLSDFPQDTMMDAMGFTVDEKTEEKIYTWAKDENLGILYEKIDGEYVLTSDTEVDLSKTYYVDILKHDNFSEDYTYGWRYISDEDNPEVVQYCKDRWEEFYRFVVDSTDEEFHAHLGDYAVVDSLLYYYLFTSRYLMIDNRSKNCFIHYGKTGEVDAEGNPIRKFDLSWNYDDDSSLGINNFGDLIYRYGLEDNDVDDTGIEVFRESDSTFFCRIRDLFSAELKALYNTLESQNAWHAESLINEFDAWQSQFPEELWRVDIERKYLRTYNSSFIDGKGDPQFLTNMAQGKKKYQRRQFERNQEKYMASKYQSSLAASDNAVIRCNAPDGDLAVEPNYKLEITPYAYMYLNVKYGTASPIQLRAEPNKTYEIPFAGSKTDIIDIYSASFIQSLGDLSSTYPATVDVGKATKLKELNIGSDVEGYDNPSLTSITLGENELLERLNVENVSSLTTPLDLSKLKNLEELYAHGSNISGVTFANGGDIHTAEIPAIGSLTMKNLMYLTNLDIASLDKLTSMTVEECDSIDVKAMIENAPKLNRVRITGIDWVLEDTSLLEHIYTMAGIDKNGYNVPKSVLAGTVSVPVIRQQQLADYTTAWPDLEIKSGSIIEQLTVTFKNTDGSILDVQYVDKGGDAVDPLYRVENPIPTPVQEPTVSTSYTFAGWDASLKAIFADRTITATYTGETRSYTVKYVSKNATLQETVGFYGDTVFYEGSIPTYTAEEAAYKYYLFKGWDKSGYIDGDKTINALYDSFEYSAGVFDNKELAELTPVQIYALQKIGIENTGMTLEDGDPYSMQFGYDVDYTDIPSQVIVSETQTFSGTSYVDTGINLFDEDKDFVLAIDYDMSKDTAANSVIAQCFQSNGSNGFKLWYNNGVKATWGTSSVTATTGGVREMIILRHRKGENNLTVYNSNMMSTEISVSELERTKSTIVDNTLVFGCAKADDGAYENYATGHVYWSKIWYGDLGDVDCRRLAGWVHEKVDFEMSGIKRYYLSQNNTKRCNFSLLAKNLLAHERPMHTESSNTGGWAKAYLNQVLNTRMYEYLPSQIKAILQQVVVASSIGNQSTEISTSDCYITIPAAIDVDNKSEVNKEPYIYEGSTISYMINNDARKRAYRDGAYAKYWLRSPNISYSTPYYYQVDATGVTAGFGTPKSTGVGVLIEMSF